MSSGGAWSQVSLLDQCFLELNSWARLYGPCSRQKSVAKAPVEVKKSRTELVVSALLVGLPSRCRGYCGVSVLGNSNPFPSCPLVGVWLEDVDCLTPWTLLC